MPCFSICPSWSNFFIAANADDLPIDGQFATTSAEVNFPSLLSTYAFTISYAVLFTPDLSIMPTRSSNSTYPTSFPLVFYNQIGALFYLLESNQIYYSPIITLSGLNIKWLDSKSLTHQRSKSSCVATVAYSTLSFPFSVQMSSTRPIVRRSRSGMDIPTSIHRSRKSGVVNSRSVALSFLRT